MDTLNTIPAPPQLVLFRGEANPKQLQTAGTDLPVPLEMISLFEAISGWVVEFHLSPANQRRLAQGSSEGISSKGSFAIVDMSAQWPANRPAASRIKCDQFLKLLNGVVGRSQLLEDELKRSQQFFAQTIDSGNDEVRDSFAPRHPYLTQSELHSDFVLSDEQHADAPVSVKSIEGQTKSEANLRTGTDDAFSPVPHWQIGGRRGIHENRYVDWAIRKDHRIELIVGQIESPEHCDGQPNQEWETKLTISPETSRFWFSVEPRGCYWMLDSSTSRLTRISEYSKISQLDARQALVVTTADCDVIDFVDLGLESQSHLFQNADELASAIQDCLQTDEPLLVLLRQ